ncbi:MULTISPECIES: hypothetical protein [unclassified Duganella]|uniref:hypothetical protein n=1 Tax=unclassified Duganella TaxID=2636909 RepID=UPI000889321A|nr:MULTISPECIES: hypothetical protein [unclassified Duganella]SDH42084.1 hypothetical protein SAMN05216320_11335 [Duganella sp. OV458]SDK60296.1 hypothetical protein SAMN05428973_113127 [Duganella sp. OV510]
MAKQKIYVLRGALEGKQYYLDYVSTDGCSVTFHRNIKRALTFTAEQREHLIAQHGHIRGRWVLLAREQARRTAQEAG